MFFASNREFTREAGLVPQDEDGESQPPAFQAHFPSFLKEQLRVLLLPHLDVDDFRSTPPCHSFSDTRRCGRKVQLDWAEEARSDTNRLHRTEDEARTSEVEAKRYRMT
eukprot:9155027-Heterocapsa_arctica.AAC.1